MKQRGRARNSHKKERVAKQKNTALFGSDTTHLRREEAIWKRVLQKTLIFL